LSEDFGLVVPNNIQQRPHSHLQSLPFDTAQSHFTLRLAGSSESGAVRLLDCWFEFRRGHRCLSCESCVLCRHRSLRRADPSSRGVLRSVCVMECDQAQFQDHERKKDIKKENSYATFFSYILLICFAFNLVYLGKQAVEFCFFFR
jgi:hypothetical protein